MADSDPTVVERAGRPAEDRFSYDLGRHSKRCVPQDLAQRHIGRVGCGRLAAEPLNQEARQLAAPPGHEVLLHLGFPRQLARQQPNLILSSPVHAPRVDVKDTQHAQAGWLAA